jgi:hypothetical protein
MALLRAGAGVRRLRLGARECGFHSAWAVFDRASRPAICDQTIHKALATGKEDHREQRGRPSSVSPESLPDPSPHAREPIRRQDLAVPAVTEPDTGQSSFVGEDPRGLGGRHFDHVEDVFVTDMTVTDLAASSDLVPGDRTRRFDRDLAQDEPIARGVGHDCPQDLSCGRGFEKCAPLHNRKLAVSQRHPPSGSGSVWNVHLSPRGRGRPIHRPGEGPQPHP